MGGSLAPKLTRQRVTWVWEYEEESDAAASPNHITSYMR